jgi:hypothetical protein
VYRTRYNTLILNFVTDALHRKCFSRSSLSISKYSTIVALQHTFNNWKCSLLKYRRLLAIRSKHCVISKIPCWRKIVFLWIDVLDCNSSLWLVDMNYLSMTLGNFFRRKGAAPNNDLDRLSLRNRYLGWHNSNNYDYFKSQLFKRKKRKWNWIKFRSIFINFCRNVYLLKYK